MSKNQICVPILVYDMTSLHQQLIKIDYNKIDMLEIRLDYCSNIDDLINVDEIFSVLISYVKVPYIITLRTKNEGGYYLGNYHQYKQIYQYILENYSCYAIDIEWHYAQQLNYLIELAQEKNIRCIVSYHNFEQVPDEEELELIYKEMQSTSAMVYKFAVFPNDYEDIICLLKFVEKLDEKHQYIIIAMGEIGTVSRIVPNLFKSILTFGSLEYTSALGQLRYDELKKVLELVNKN